MSNIGLTIAPEAEEDMETDVSDFQYNPRSIALGLIVIAPLLLVALVSEKWKRLVETVLVSSLGARKYGRRRDFQK